MSSQNNTPTVGDMRVWHCPQIPCKPFHVPVASLAEAKKVLALLAQYDLFQLENRIKPDYANANGLEVYEDDYEGGLDWCEWCDNETGNDIHKWEEA